MINIAKCHMCDTLTMSRTRLCAEHEKHLFASNGMKKCEETLRSPDTIKVPMPYCMVMPKHIETDTHVAVPVDLRTLDGLDQDTRDMLKPVLQKMLNGLEIVRIPDQVNILKHNNISHTTWGAYVRKTVWYEECDKPAPRGVMYIPKHMQ